MSLVLLFNQPATATVAEVTQPAGGYDDAPKKKRYFVKHKEQLFVFDSRKAADKAMRRFQADEDAEVKPALAVSLPVVAEYAEVSGKIDSYNAAYNSAQYAQLLALFEQMQDEEDIELLLLSL